MIAILVVDRDFVCRNVQVVRLDPKLLRIKCATSSGMRGMFRNHRRKRALNPLYGIAGSTRIGGE
jgi:hypothetical protein